MQITTTNSNDIIIIDSKITQEIDPKTNQIIIRRDDFAYQPQETDSEDDNTISSFF